jgi:hypothetical protein
MDKHGYILTLELRDHLLANKSLDITVTSSHPGAALWRLSTATVPQAHFEAASMAPADSAYPRRRHRHIIYQSPDTTQLGLEGPIQAFVSQAATVSQPWAF